ncbi:MAG: peptidase S41 [Phycisphaerae bacterium]|nr:peptidase S41 [Phycisphaerae bacterium]MCZ2399094.1 peptidase S41 [Phycisphaerae bacterium]
MKATVPVAALILALAAGTTAEEPLDIESGQVGAPPPGWSVPTAGYAAELREGGAAAGSRAARLSSKAEARSPFGNLMRSVDAAPYRGKVVRFRAAVRVEGAGPDDRGQLWLRVDRPDQKMGFFDNMGDRPIESSAWSRYEIIGDVARDAVSLNLGLMLVSRGAAWLDEVSLEIVGEVEPPRPLTPRGLENLEALARLVGYVRYFHPSDQARDADWAALTAGGVRSVEEAADARELAAALGAIVGNVAPTVQVFVTGQAPPLPAELSAAPAGRKIAYWEHLGVGLSEQTRTIYHSTRHERSLAEARAAGEVSAPDEPFECELPGGVSCRVPLAVYMDEGGTLPHRATPEKTARWYSGNDRASRLAAVILAWNVFQHFYPYFDVAGVSWEDELRKALSAAAQDADERAFLDTLRTMVAALRDGHGNVIHRCDTRHAQLPLAWDWIEDQLVITAVAKASDDEPAPELEPGDVVLAIDGRPAGEALADCQRRVSAATPHFARYRALLDLRRGEPGKATLRIRRADGEPRDVRVAREFRSQPVEDPRPEPVAEVRPGVWYVDVGRVTDADFRSAVPNLEKAKGIVFDFRGYPTQLGAQTLFGHLSAEPLTSQRWTIPVVTRPDMREHLFRQMPGWRLAPRQPLLSARRAFIIDARAISYAESCLGIVEHYGLGQLVGGPTAGTNGNINPFTLPGGYQVVWTGMRVLKHDGSPHHGCGIQPTQAVSRTISGVRAGRDELLEAAIRAVSE